jgi:acyl dehydratase
MVPDSGQGLAAIDGWKGYNRAAFTVPDFTSSAEDEAMTHLYFEDAEIGTTSKAGPYLVSKEEIVQFAKQYDPVPRHLDEEAAARSIFGGLTASSAHTFAVFISLTPKLQPRLHVLAGMGWDELRLPNPVRPGDELDLEMIVLEKRESKSKPDRGIMRNQIRLRNHRSEIVLQCIANILVARRTGP